MAPACSAGNRQRKAASTSTAQSMAATATIASGWGHASPKAASIPIMPNSATVVAQRCQPASSASRATPRRTVSPHAKIGTAANAAGSDIRLSAAAMPSDRTTVIPNAISMANAAVPSSVKRLPASAAVSRLRGGSFARYVPTDAAKNATGRQAAEMCHQSGDSGLSQRAATRIDAEPPSTAMTCSQGPCGTSTRGAPSQSGEDGEREQIGCDRAGPPILFAHCRHPQETERHQQRGDH